MDTEILNFGIYEKKTYKHVFNKHKYYVIKFLETYQDFDDYKKMKFFIYAFNNMKLDFGKYSGQTFNDIYNNHITYIIWCRHNIKITDNRIANLFHKYILLRNSDKFVLPKKNIFKGKN